MRTLILILSLFLISANAFAETLVYSPEVSSVTVAPGSEAEVPLTVTLADAQSGTYYLWFVDSIEGDLPIEWITGSPSTSFLSKWWTSASTTLKVAVPEGTTPGTYGGYLYSKAKRSHQYADQGNGIYLEVYVPANCAAKPGIKITSFGPSELWPPNGSMEQVRVEGVIENPTGCNIFEFGYSIDDEYGVYTEVGQFTIAGTGGEFSVAIPVEASRLGRDKDGRNYTITLYAEDEAGIASGQPLEVLVPHDQRK